jgi:hypothetical protein
VRYLKASKRPSSMTHVHGQGSDELRSTASAPDNQLLSLPETNDSVGAGTVRNSFTLLYFSSSFVPLL